MCIRDSGRGHAHGPVPGRYNRIDPGAIGGPQAGSEVVRILHSIEHEKQRSRVRFKDLLQVGLISLDEPSVEGVPIFTRYGPFGSFTHFFPSLKHSCQDRELTYFKSLSIPSPKAVPTWAKSQGLP